MKIPVIDIFAGPGGLSEGFSRHRLFKDSEIDFDIKLSIEKDPIAAETLTLRAFFHQFEPDAVPQKYYEYLRGEIPISELQELPEWAVSKERVWNDELGVIPEADLHSRISAALDGARDWVLLGGPPCQAYSLIGRARMIGLGQVGQDGSVAAADLALMKTERRSAFFDDIRHTLYREYLRIVAVHQPAVFVMENVKGILSSKVKDDVANGDDPYRPVFPAIRNDLRAPWEALAGDPLHNELIRYRTVPQSKYRLYSFVSDPPEEPALAKDRDFLIRSEKHGIPQNRHRVIVLGVREDIALVPDKLSNGTHTTVRSVIGRMPKLRSGLSKEQDDPESWRAAIAEQFDDNVLCKLGDGAVADLIGQIVGQNDSKFERGGRFVECEAPAVEDSDELRHWMLDLNVEGVIQHETRAHMRSDLVRYLFAAAVTEISGLSPKLPQWPGELLPAHKNVRVDKETGQPVADGFVDRFRVQTWCQPSSTITSHIAKDGHYFIHPDPEQCRSLTVREAARLQTFPDNYFFCGNRTQQYQQIGNAVPPFLALQLAEIVAGLIEACAHKQPRLPIRNT